MDREAEARAIVERARGERTRTPRWLWIIALVTSVVSVGALAIAWIEDRDTLPVEPLARHPHIDQSSGLGLLVGIVVVVAICSMIALRRRRAPKDL